MSGVYALSTWRFLHRTSLFPKPLFFPCPSPEPGVFLPHPPRVTLLVRSFFTSEVLAPPLLFLPTIRSIGRDFARSQLWIGAPLKSSILESLPFFLTSFFPPATPRFKSFQFGLFFILSCIQRFPEAALAILSWIFRDPQWSHVYPFLLRQVGPVLLFFQHSQGWDAPPLPFPAVENCPPPPHIIRTFQRVA